MRLGKLKKGGPFGPGLFFVVPCLDDIITVDLRTVTFDVPPQEILTKAELQRRFFEDFGGGPLILDP